MLSYVRGFLRGDTSDGHDYVARPGKTVTGICGTYHAGDDTLRLAGLLWTDGGSNGAQDLKRRWIFSQADGQSLQKWIRLLHEEGVRELMRVGRETAQLRIFDGTKAFLAHSRKFFDVGENAFSLLNRAVGLKQLNSIDEIFRELVLDDRSVFERALEVASEFDNLAEIRSELETARQQQASLAPIQAIHKTLKKTRKKAPDTESLKRILPIWFAMACVRAWTRKLNTIDSETEIARRQLAAAESSKADCQIQVDTLRQKYLQLGGNVIGELETNIKTLAERVAERRKYVDDYHRLVSRFGFSDELSELALKRNQQEAAATRTEIEKLRAVKQEETLQVLSQQRDVETQSKELSSELVKSTDPQFHSLFVRRRSLWRNTPVDEVVQAARLAIKLEPGCAEGRPLRLISLAGIDTKFFERNARLVTTLLDVRYDDEVSRLGLEVFLGALLECDHWLLVADLDGSLLPFRRQRVGSSELKDSNLPGQRLLIVENESCLHQLPLLHDTIAVLGAGFDLSWTVNAHLADKQVGYWGDIDTWGLQFLARLVRTSPTSLRC